MAFETRLIKAVRAHPALYNPKDSDYGCRKHKSKIWHSISKELDEPAHVLRKRWKSLRDMFARILKRVQAGHGPAAMSWKYFRDMVFLREFMKIGMHSSKYDDECDPLDGQKTDADADDSDSNTTATFATAALQPKRCDSIVSTESIVPKNEEQNMLVDEAILDSENLLFFRSIASKMDKLPKSDQRNLQVEILCLVNSKLNQYDL